MDEDGPAEECEVCGGTDFYKEAGHFYCNECQTQSQQIREQVFEQEEATVNKKSTKKIQKDKINKTEDKLTSWECYNVILKGLTEELIGLGAKPEIKPVVRCLWMKYLHKCEVFDTQSDRPPKVSILGLKKDIEILYNVNRRKRQRSRTSSTSTTLSIRRQRSSKKRALIHSQYEELSQSQTLTQDSTMVEETLSSLKSGSAKPESSEKVGYNRYSNAALKDIMSKKHRQQHKYDVTGDMSCHKLRVRDFPKTFVQGPANLTSFTLYSILYVGLLIIEDSVQLGDILRFIREGHLSFCYYRHFFDEDMLDKSLNLPRRNDKLFNNEYFRKRTAKLVHFLNVENYIKKPDLVQLCSRYCTELNLPKEIFECVEKLIVRTAPQMSFGKNSKEIPNYEGRAMSFVLFTLKLFFSLDGVTEKKLSDFAKMLNDRQTETKMFDFLEWLKYIGYRDTVITTHHMPSSRRGCDNIDSDMYLEYIKNQRINFRGESRHVQNEVKDYLQVFDKLLENDCEKGGSKFRFEHSLTPYLKYTNVILETKKISCENVLRRTFTEDSINFLLRPNDYLGSLGNESVKNGGANDNIVIEDTLYLYKNLRKRRKYNHTVTVKVSDDIESDRFITECFNSDRKTSLKPTDVGVFLSNWQKGNEKRFLKNRVLLKLASESVKLNVENDSCSEMYTEHYNPFERYWLNIPGNPINIQYFSKNRMQELKSKLSRSFNIILDELTRTIEQDTYYFYAEFLVTELNLVYFEGYCSKSKKLKVPEIQNVLKDCLKKW